jgi:peptidoglycan-associated lipoprotein
MKRTLIYSLALALVATLATTGCKHKPGTITKLPPAPTPVLPSEPGPGSTIGGGGGTRFNTDNNPGVIPIINPVESADPNLRHFMLPDRAALAAFTIHFAYDSAAIRKSEQANLQEVAKALSADPKTKVIVEGNCDERGTEEYNRSLGERRALAAREALTKLGVDPMRVFTESFGKDQPADTGHDEAAWQKNRRDDFVLLHPKPGA